MLEKFGIDPASLPQQFSSIKNLSDKILIMDGDGACYEAASSYVRLDTALRSLKTKILEAMYLTKCKEARVHLTPKGCKKNSRDHLIGVKKYQANRIGKPKPALLEPLRATASTKLNSENIEVLAHYDIEADDAVMQDAICFGDNCIVWSPDKDLQIVPAPLYNIYLGTIDYIKDRYGWTKEAYTEGGKFKVAGHGTKFFWTQMLMGDTADNVKGIITYEGKLCGPSRAFSILKDAGTENEAANIVLNGYRKINQNPIPEAEMLWLTRFANDSALKYLSELKLSPENADFLDDCKHREYIDIDNNNETA